MKTKKFWYKRWWAIVFFVIVGLIILGNLFPELGIGFSKERLVRGDLEDQYEVVSVVSYEIGGEKIASLRMKSSGYDNWQVSQGLSALGHGYKDVDKYYITLIPDAYSEKDCLYIINGPSYRAWVDSIDLDKHTDNRALLDSINSQIEKTSESCS